jgi:hypothetical protein
MDKAATHQSVSDDCSCCSSCDSNPPDDLVEEKTQDSSALRSVHTSAADLVNYAAYCLSQLQSGCLASVLSCSHTGKYGHNLHKYYYHLFYESRRSPGSLGSGNIRISRPKHLKSVQSSVGPVRSSLYNLRRCKSLWVNRLPPMWREFRCEIDVKNAFFLCFDNSTAKFGADNPQNGLKRAPEQLNSHEFLCKHCSIDNSTHTTLNSARSDAINNETRYSRAESARLGRLIVQKDRQRQENRLKQAKEFDASNCAYEKAQINGKISQQSWLCVQFPSNKAMKIWLSGLLYLFDGAGKQFGFSGADSGPSEGFEIHFLDTLDRKVALDSSLSASKDDSLRVRPARHVSLSASTELREEEKAQKREILHSSAEFTVKFNGEIEQKGPKGGENEAGLNESENYEEDDFEDNERKEAPKNHRGTQEINHNNHGNSDNNNDDNNNNNNRNNDNQSAEKLASGGSNLFHFESVEALEWLASKSQKISAAKVSQQRAAARAKISAEMKKLRAAEAYTAWSVGKLQWQQRQHRRNAQKAQKIKLAEQQMAQLQAQRRAKSARNFAEKVAQLDAKKDLKRAEEERAEEARVAKESARKTERDQKFAEWKGRKECIIRELLRRREEEAREARSKEEEEVEASKAQQQASSDAGVTEPQ